MPLNKKQKKKQQVNNNLINNQKLESLKQISFKFGSGQTITDEL